MCGCVLLSPQLQTEVCNYRKVLYLWLETVTQRSSECAEQVKQEERFRKELTFQNELTYEVCVLNC